MHLLGSVAVAVAVAASRNTGTGSGSNGTGAGTNTGAAAHGSGSAFGSVTGSGGVPGSGGVTGSGSGGGGCGLPVPSHCQYLTCEPAAITRSLRPLESLILLEHSIDTIVLFQLDREEAVARLVAVMAGVSGVPHTPSGPPIHAAMVVEAVFRVLMGLPGPMVPIT
jgi:hypothetical protein